MKRMLMLFVVSLVFTPTSYAASRVGDLKNLDDMLPYLECNNQDARAVPDTSVDKAPEMPSSGRTVAQKAD